MSDPVYVYFQGGGKDHAFREGWLPAEVEPYVWRVRTRCGQQLDDARRSFFGYSRGSGRCCRHCFPDEVAR